MSSITPEELNLLIEQTYKVEKDFADLKGSYDHLQDTIEKVVEFLPNPIWILNDDNSIFLQNSHAKELKELLVFLEPQKDNYEVTYESSSYLVKSSSYQDKLMFSATDITEQKRKENLATMGQMAAHLSHEIRNPIGSISLLSSTLKKRVIPENIPIVEEIQKSVHRIDRIIKATLMFSKGIITSKSSFMWSTLKESVCDSVSYYAFSKDIKFTFPIEDFSIDGDIDLLEMLFSNFIVNAIDAIEEDENEEGDIDIKYKNENNFHKFFITDSGIDIENKTELFEAFKSTKLKGNGLGLILSREIAESHDGYVKLMDGEVKGFEIALPIVTKEC